VHEVEKKNWIVILGLSGLCLGIRLAFFLASNNFAYDAVIRTEIAGAWAKNPFFILPPQLNLPPQYSPLPIYLYGLGLKLIDNPQIVPRLISLFWGTMTLVPFYFLMTIIFGRRKANISSLFFCVYTLLIESAVVASSESIFCFFLLMAIWRLYVYKSSGKKSDLLSAVIFMNLSGMSRYNGWLYIPLLTLLVPENLRKISKQEIWGMICFGLGSLIFPLIWMFASWRVYGDFLYPIHFIFADHLRVIARTGLSWSSWQNKLYLFFFWPGVLFLSLTPPVAVLVVMGVTEAGKERWGVHPLILAIVPTAVIFFRVLVSETFFPMARFVTDGGIFLLGYAALGYERVVNFYQIGKGRWPPVVIGGATILSLFTLAAVGLSDIPRISSKIQSVSPLVRLEPTQEQISSFLKKHMTEKDRVVLDSYRDWSEIEIIFYSGYSRANFFARWHRQSQLIDWIRKMRPRFLVTGPGGRAWKLIQNRDILAQLRFKSILLKKAGKQNVYLLEPK
jgi:4-amino-4-deoxy-L-arabinose transferase-like glycosyltransferase